MNSLTSAFSHTYKPELAIVVHATKENMRGDAKYYLESHSISADGKILEGKPLQQETLDAMVEVFFEDRKDKSQLGGYVPENLLSFDPATRGKYRMVWYKPAEIRYLHFVSHLKIKSGKAWIPPMIYSVHGSDLFVYATKSNTRPKGTTKAYRAPFHNVSDTGKVCLGNASVKKPTLQTFVAAMKYWEDLFWLSEFSHLNGASNPTKTALGSVWKKLIARNPTRKWSEIDELKPMRKVNLENIIK